MIEGLKPFYNAVLRPFARIFVVLHIHPNAITFFGVVLFAAAGYLISQGQWRFAVAVALAGSLMDGMDGLVAREFNLKSVFGGVWDSVCDRLTEIAVFGGMLVFYLLHPQGSFYPMLALFFAVTGSLMVSYVKARAEGAGLACSKGILQRPERLIILASGLLAGKKGLPWALAAIALLSTVTVVQRIVEVAGNARQQDRKGST